jgi:hypothetical protein
MLERSDRLKPESIDHEAVLPAELTIKKLPIFGFLATLLYTQELFNSSSNINPHEYGSMVSDCSLMEVWESMGLIPMPGTMFISMFAKRCARRS